MKRQDAHIQRRSYPRTSTFMEARFFHGNMFYSGTITSISEKGVFLCSKRCLPSGSMCVLLFQSEHKILQAIAKTARIGKKGSYPDGMGMEIIGPSLDYLKFVRSKKG